MNLSPLQILQKKKTLKEYWILVLSLTFVYAIVCVPISIVTTTDAVVMDSSFPLIWETLMQVLNYVFYWISFAYLMYFVFSFGIGESRDFLVAYGLSVCLRYGLNQFVTSSLYGFPSVEEFVANSLSEMIFFIIMDLLQMAVATWIVYLISKKRVTLNDNLPFQRLFDFKNPLVATAFKLSMIPAVVMLVQRFIYDLGYVREMPKEFLMFLGVIIFYLSDLLCILVGHFVILFLLNHFFLRNEKIRALYEEKEQK